MSNLQSQLRELLYSIVINAGDSFSGIGLIVYSDKTRLPITNLKNIRPKLSGDLLTDLVCISSINSEYHDGFHLINEEWVITDVSQFFSPPIYRKELLNRNKNIGGRYAAAQFGSAIDGVEMTGIASNGIGIAIFQNGYEIYSEDTL